MRILYLECCMGAAGDMLMGALLELIEDRESFLRQINDIGFNGVHVNAEPSIKCGIKGTHVSVIVGDKEEGVLVEETNTNADSCHHEDLHHSRYCDSDTREIEEALSSIPIPVSVREDALAVYRIIAEAEAHVHGCNVDKVHFHEVGDIDAIIDIVGVCLLMNELRPDRVVISPVCVGSGHVRCAHGILPVPAPATAFILRGSPCYGGEIKSELCTPTGAALLRHFADEFGPMPEMLIEKIGYGMGQRDFCSPNCVRAFLGDASDARDDVNGYVAVLECNIDDMTGEALGFARTILMQEGAYDVFTCACDMKNDRPGILLTCMCDPQAASGFATLILRHTTTFGIRKSILGRYMLDRTITEEQTSLGTVRVKTGTGYGVERSKLEYVDVAEIAALHNITIEETERIIWSELCRKRECVDDHK